ncbi:MAG: transglutaminase domain-containing protein, partial [Chloroflexi bacterium]
MVIRGISWLWNLLKLIDRRLNTNRRRNRFDSVSTPNDDWLAFLLVGSAVTCLILAVLEVGWVPEDGVIMPAAMLGLIWGVVLAKRPLRWQFAWIFITLYGFVITIIHLANLWPPISNLILNDDFLLTPFWRQNSALFYDRMASWFKAVFSGGSSRETIVFAVGLGLFAWFLAAYSGWSTFRQHKPLHGLTLMGMAMALNGYFGNAQLYWVAIFVGLVAVLTAVLHYTRMEFEWRANGVDYSDEVRLELIVFATIIATVLLTFSATIPAINFKELVRRFQSQQAVQQTEDILGRAFAGVRQPQRSTSPGGVGGSGIMPRSYLLGNPPELSERVMMTTQVNLIDENGGEIIAPPSILHGYHWRGLSYDVYTGRGWALSQERQEPTPANQPLLLPPISKQLQLSQSVNWEFDERVIRYTLGLPLKFDHDVTVNWRGLEDLSRVQGEEINYHVITQLTSATPEDLQATSLQDVPPAIMARYTALPNTVPQRVHNLANEVAGNLQNPYDQARAIEQFLRQYPYTLDVELPPKDMDVVEFFLFDLQAGYCDYYSSSMAVMARSLGLPARVAVGYLAQQPDEFGAQTIYQINGHSWTEIYFADYGWVEFEPTGSFPSPQDAQTFLSESTGEITTPENELPPPSIPEKSPVRRLRWQRFLLLLLLAVPFGWYWW